MEEFILVLHSNDLDIIEDQYNQWNLTIPYLFEKVKLLLDVSISHSIGHGKRAQAALDKWHNGESN